MPLGFESTRTTSPTPSIVSTVSVMTEKHRFTFVPIGSGDCVRTKTPVFEMFVTYSWMNASNDSNSLLMVSRSSARLSSLTRSIYTRRMTRTLRDLVKGFPRSTDGFPAALAFCKKHKVPAAVVTTLKVCAFKGWIECDSGLRLGSFAKLPSANRGVHRRALDNGFLIVGECPNGDPLAVELATKKMVYISHDVMHEQDEEDEWDDKSVARTNLTIDRFWSRAEDEKDFPCDYYAATE